MRRPEAHQEKLKTLLAYFRQIIKERPTGLVTFTRQAVKREDLPNWVTNSSNIPTNLLRLSSTGYIEEEGKGMLQVDFANKIIGGGVLGQGLVQEEIRFIICPELIISRLFTEKLEDNEVIFMHGAQQFSKIIYQKKVLGKDLRINLRRRNTTIVAMDAISFRQDPKIQYEERQLIRELNKAFVGFLPVNKNISRLNGVATGNWGCGAFQGDPQLKFLVQLLACVITGRKLCYFTFGDEGLVREGWRVYNIIVDKQITVAKLFNVLRTYQNRRQRSQTVFQFIEMKLSPQDGESCSSSQTNGAENYLVDTDDELDFGDKSENKTAGRENGAKKGISAGKVYANKDDDDILSIYKNKEESTNADNNTDTIHHDEVNFEAVNRMEEGRSLDPNTSYSSKETPNGNVDTSRSNIKVQQVMEVIDVETESLTYTLNTSTVQIEVNHTKKAQTKITDFFAK